MSHWAFQGRGLAFSYPGGTPALEEVDLDIAVGERVALLGANGSGKSTLLKMLDALYFATGGELLAFGHPLTEEAMADDAWAFSFRRRVGLVFQNSDVQLFSPTVWDEIAFGPLQLGLSHEVIAERVQAMLARLGIEKLADRPPHRLSGGEQKKVALASVLVLEPGVLLLDEPTASLDPRTQDALLDILREMHGAGGTIITATHDLDVVSELADRAYFLDETHRIVHEGPIDDTLADDGLLLRCNLARARAVGVR
ncbi:MAG: energy-coupling factor ABC transporter ATP-binding protein [Bacteroidetes bacterium]|nr:energy-coupling factor ABC transporter ATP-binding protein [Bacteroidota bacterium]MCL5026904.1 energy-coupling factor ABC transporter ATP-binding protein [Chloroflexota bacterium]